MTKTIILKSTIEHYIKTGEMGKAQDLVSKGVQKQTKDKVDYILIKQ